MLSTSSTCTIDRKNLSHSFCLYPDELRSLFDAYPNINSSSDLKCMYESGKLPKKVRKTLEKYMLPSVKPDDLLSEIDILIAMKQWQRLIPQLKFIGVYASNVFTTFASLRKSIQKSIKLFTAEDRKNKIAIILNTDRINTEGSHWVAIIVCSNYVEYFDPLGKTPNDEIAKSLKSLAPSKTLIINDTRLQPKGSIQCGVWCIVFILERVTGCSKSMEDFVGKRYSESDMDRFRKKLFGQFSDC